MHHTRSEFRSVFSYSKCGVKAEEEAEQCPITLKAYWQRYRHCEWVDGVRASASPSFKGIEGTEGQEGIKIKMIV